MYVIVFVEMQNTFCGEKCIPKKKNTGMLGVYFSKSVSQVRINVLDGSCKTHFLGVQKCVLQLPSHIWQKTRLWK